MNNLLIQLTGALVLLAAIGWGYTHWVRRHADGIEAKLLLMLLILTLTGGFIGSVGWWIDDTNAFSWDLPPLASRMLGAAGWAFGAAALMALRRPVETRIRLILLMLSLYLVPLAGAIVAFHLDRFDFSAPIAYAFFGIVIAMIVPTLWFLFRRPVIIADSAWEVAPPTVSTRNWLAFVALVTGVWAIALFVSDRGPVASVWVWPGDLLTSRLIAVMLLTIAAACAASVRAAGAARMTLAVMMVYGFGVVLAGLLNLAAGKPVPALYTLSFAGIGMVSAFLFNRQAS